MAHERSRNLVDAQWTDTFGLSATTGTAVASASFDLGADVHKPEGVEFSIEVPALPNAVIVEGGDLIVKVEHSDSDTFSDDRACLYERIVASTVGTSALSRRARLPSDCGRYVRASVEINDIGTTGGATAATYVATFEAKF